MLLAQSQYLYQCWLIITHFNEKWIKMQISTLFEKMYWKMSSKQLPPFCWDFSVMIWQQVCEMRVRAHASNEYEKKSERSHKISKASNWDCKFACHYTRRFNEVEREIYWFRVIRTFIRLSICLWTESFLLCNFHNTGQIHFKSLLRKYQKVCQF